MHPYRILQKLISAVNCREEKKAKHVNNRLCCGSKYKKNIKTLPVYVVYNILICPVLNYALNARCNDI